MQLSRFTLKRLIAWVAVASATLYVVFERPPHGYAPINMLMAAVVSILFGLKAMQHPKITLYIWLAAFTLLPAFPEGISAFFLCVFGACLTWPLGTLAGWYNRRRSMRRVAHTSIGGWRTPSTYATGGFWRS